MKFRVGDRVLVTDAGREIEGEPATIEEVDERDGEYWCVFDRGCKTERETWEGLSLEETRLDPGWIPEEQVQEA